MDSDFEIYWSNESIDNLESIFEYLSTNWSQKEVNNFKRKLAKQLDLIVSNPKLFPVSEYNPRLRKAVLSKQTTIFYELSGQRIYLVYLFNNKKDIDSVREAR
ncbi:MAG: type II toxin-antitoxin system RelE/ParE family toxin [Bacteroidetes bacterium]|nr:type II toxin-antitoxin system RelE/ParE family toxin [Bacteroidota bacterium]